MKHSIYLYCLLFCAVSCMESTSDDSVIVDGYDVRFEGSLDLSINVDMIPLELTDDSLLDGIQKIVCHDSFFIVQDLSSNLYRFDKNGKFVNRISNKGRSQEEYIRLNSFCVDSLGHVILFDSFGDRVLTFKMDGSFVEEKKLPSRSLYEMHNAFMISQNEVLLENYIMGDYNEVYSIVSLDNGKREVVHKSLLKTDGIGQYIGKNTISGKGEIKCILPFDNIIYSLDENHALSEFITIRTREKIVNQKLLSEQKDFSIETYLNIGNRGYFQGFTSFFENDKYYLLTFFDLRYFLIDKRTMSGTYFTNDNMSFPMVNIVASSEDCFFGYIDEMSIMHFPRLSEYNLQENVNPIIIRYTMN